MQHDYLNGLNRFREDGKTIFIFIAREYVIRTFHENDCGNSEIHSKEEVFENFARHMVDGELVFELTYDLADDWRKPMINMKSELGVDMMK